MESHGLTTEEKKQNTDILVIGAGPVGLRFVIEILKNGNQAKKQNLMITLIERNKSYTRTQDIAISTDLLESDAYLKDQVALLVDEERASKDSQGNIHIPIQELEKCLSTYAAKLGVKIEHKRFMTTKQFATLLNENGVNNREALEKKLEIGIIIDREEIALMYPGCKIVIGADGARSSVRQLISGKNEDDSVDKKDLRYLIEVKYAAEGKVKKLSKINYYRSQALLHGFLCAESIKYNKLLNQAQVTLRFLVDEQTYFDPRLKNINAKNLLPLSGDFPLPSLLRKVINIWISLRSDILVVDSATINKTILSVYSSHIFATGNDKQAILLLGDAANGFPYMNGAKIGTRQAIKTAEMLLSNIQAIQQENLESLNQLVKDFTQMTRNIFDEGFKIIALKDNEITNNQRVAQSIFVTSSFVKMPERLIRENDHSVFSVKSKFYTLDLTELNSFVERCSSDMNNEYYNLGMSLLVHLIDHQRSIYKNPEKIKFDFLRTVLHLADGKGQLIFELNKNRSFLTSFNKYEDDFFGYKKSITEISIDEIDRALNFEAGSVQENHELGEFHNIIFDLYKATIKLEYRFKGDSEEKLSADEPRKKSYFKSCTIS